MPLAPLPFLDGSAIGPGQAVLIAAGLLFAAKTLAWLIQRRLSNAGIVDGIWAWALGGLAVWFGAVGSAPPAVRLTLALMGGLWGLRLGAYLWRRNWRTPEDWRYAQFRAEWGPQAQFKMFWFFQFQNLFTLALACSAFMPAAYREGEPPLWASALAVLTLVLAVGGEALADAQLSAFKARVAKQPDAAQAVCDEGLWRHSRHPNYFFECVHWLAYLPLAWGSPLWPWALGAPLVMLLLIRKVSGVPLMEAEQARRKPAYAAYMARTRMLLPWPRRGASA
jgi:steroid 5-alpha reductase family enzyme